MQPSAPLRRHRRRTPHRAKQRAGNRRNSIGVAPTADRGLQRQPQMIGPKHSRSRSLLRHWRRRDRRPRRLQRLHHPPVLGEIRRSRSFGRIQQRGPPVACRRIEVRQADPSVELPGQHRTADGTTPQHTRISSVRIVVSQRPDRAGPPTPSPARRPGTPTPPAPCASTRHCQRSGPSARAPPPKPRAVAAEIPWRPAALNTKRV